MAVFGLYIEKAAEYFGERRTFGNTYHYETGSLEQFQDAFVAEEVAFQEANVTENDVEFVRWATWGPTDGPAIDNVMRENGDLNTFGQVTLAVPMYREACALVVWPLPRAPVTNRRRWLRKFLRSAPGDGTPGAEVMVGAASLPPSAQAAFDSYVSGVTVVFDANAVSNQLVTEEGVPPSDTGLVRPYFYTRQIGS